ncbi:MAG: AMP-binding protein [Gammaproteobacteria bacterium]|nr:AMP-binding protein [Gammaproteobacteria bacterium]
MEKVWLNNYPPGVSEEIDLDSFSSLKDLVEKSCKTYSSQPAFSNMGREMSFGELDQKSRYLAAYLQKVAGLVKGDRVALMMPNILQYPIGIAGVLRAGLVGVNVNPLYTPRELKHQLKDSGAKAIVIVENFAHTLAEVIEDTEVKIVITTQLGDLLGFPKSLLVNTVVKKVRKMVPDWNIPGSVTFKKALAEGKWQTLEDVEVSHEDIAFLQYTGGTTGVSKGAMLTHRNLVANVEQSAAWLGKDSIGDTEIVITALPLYHIFALTANYLLFLSIGGKNILITDPRDFPGFVKELKKHRFTFISGVNTLFNALLHTPGFSEVDFSNLQVTLGGGMAVQGAVANHWKEVTGNTLVQAYGLTETSPAACINPIVEGAEFNGSIGLPIPSTEASIVDDDGNELGLGEIGEICIKGPQVMAGYWQQPEETDKVMLDGGWFRTGDMGRMDEKGFIFIEDRKKDMILVSGFNVYPNEIEAVAVEHEKILEAAAIGKADERSGEVVQLFVVKKDPSLTAAEVIEHCRKNLTGYKVPKEIIFRDDLPKTNVGKILRRELREDSPAQ